MSQEISDNLVVKGPLAGGESIEIHVKPTSPGAGGGIQSNQVVISPSVQIDATKAAIRVGGKTRIKPANMPSPVGATEPGLDGGIAVQDKAGKTRLSLSPTHVQLIDENGKPVANLSNVLSVGNNEEDGGIQIHGKGGSAKMPTVSLHGGGGKIVLRTKQGEELSGTLMLSGESGTVHVGGQGRKGRILVYPADTTHNGGKHSVEIDGEKGDIVLPNADCAEEFDLCDAESAPPGSVLVIADNGELEPCCLDYDTRTAGVVSGAGTDRPGLILDRRKSSSKKRIAIALVGKVFCLVDARRAPVKVGDLLTTSSTSGHAMKAQDLSRAVGSIVGKALQPLESGVGLIRILAALQ